MYVKFKEIIAPLITRNAKLGFHPVSRKNKKTSFLICVSGGMDSCALFDLFVRLRKEKSLKLWVAHVNHGIRGRASDQDEEFVQKLTAEAGVPFFVKRANLASVSNQEAKAREVRRSFFLSLQKKYKIDWIVTAHQKDDQQETILLNIFRGSGLEGFRGMQVQDGPFLKPLLSFSKKEIKAYLRKRKLPFKEDATNRDPYYTRNFIRLQVLPLVRKKFPAFGKTLLREAEIFSQIFQDLRKLAEPISKKSKISVTEFEKLPIAFQWQVIRNLYKHRYGSVQGLSFAQMEELRKIIVNGKTGTQKQFGPSFRLTVSYGNFFVMQDRMPRQGRKAKRGRKPLHLLTKILSLPTGRQAQKPVKFQKNIFSFDRQKINVPLHRISYRFWKPGDRFQPLGFLHEKKLQDFFTDRKIPKERRHRIPLVTADGKIIAVGNLQIDDRYKVDQGTQEILQIRLD